MKETLGTGAGTRRFDGGFTLVEVVVTLAVLGIVVVLLYGVFGSLYESWTGEGLKSEMRQNVRVALDTVTRDLEMAGFHTTNYGDANKAGLAVTRAEADKIEVDQQWLDIGAGTYEPRMIYYHLATDVATGRQNLYRQVRLRPNLAADDEIVAENIESFALTYFDADGAPVAALPALYTAGAPPPQALKDIRRICVAVEGRTERRLSRFARKVLSQQTEERESKLSLSACVTPRNMAVDEVTADMYPPCTPANLRVTDLRDCNRKLCLRWDKCSDPDLDGYILYYGTGESLRIPVSALTDLDNPGVNLTDEDILITRNADRFTAPETYAVAVAAYDSSGNISGRSAAVSGNPFPDVTDCAAGTGDTTVNPGKPGRPQGLAAVPGAEYELLLTWAAPADDGATPTDESWVVGYRLYRSETAFASGAAVPNSYLIADETALGPEAASYRDAGLKGCVTYYYALAAVNCDGSLVDTYLFDSGGAGDYAAASAAPEDDTPPPAASLSGTTAGWQRIFISLDNPTVEESDDFVRTEVWFNEGSLCPTLQGGVVANGSLVPDSDGATPGTFTGRGSQVIVFDSTTEAAPAVPALTNQGQYCLLAVTYDLCGNVATDSTSLVLIDLCGDDPPGPPPESPTNPSYSSCEPSTVQLAWEYPPKYYTGASQVYDFAGYRIWRQGPEAVTEIELTAGPRWSESWTDSNNLLEGGSYRYTIRATDCVYENRRSEFPNNYSTALFVPSISEWITPGRVGLYGGNAADDFDTANFVTTFSDPARPYSHHNNVRFHLSSSSAGTMTVESVAVEWANPNVVLQSVAVGGPPSATTLKTTAAGAVPSGVPVTVNATIEDRAAGAGQASGPVPVSLRFTNADGSVNRFADMRGERLQVTVRVANDSLQNTGCAPEKFVVVVPLGPRIGRFFQDPSCLFPTPSRAVPGSGGTARDDDLVVPPATGINVYGTVQDNSGPLFPGLGGVGQGFDTLVLRYVDAPKTPDGDVPAMPSPSTPVSLPLQSLGGSSYAIYDEGTVSGSVIAPFEDRSVWYYVLAVDRTGNFDRLPDPDFGNFAYYQGAFDLCRAIPMAPALRLSTTPSSASLAWDPPARYLDCGDIHPSDSFTYDAFAWELPGGSPGLLCGDTSSLSCTQSADLTAGSFAYAVKAKNSCPSPGPQVSAYSNVVYECEGDQDFAGQFTVLPATAALGDTVTLTAAGICLFAGNGRADTVTFRVTSSIDTRTFTATESGDSGTFTSIFATSPAMAPPPATTLSGAVTDSDGDIPVVSTAGYPAQGLILVGSELIRYGGVTGSSFTGVSRGVMGTAASGHAPGETVSYPDDRVLMAGVTDTVTCEFFTGSTLRDSKTLSIVP